MSIPCLYVLVPYVDRIHARCSLSKGKKGKGVSSSGSAGGHAYSGAAGQASGGNVGAADGITLLNFGSGELFW